MPRSLLLVALVAVATLTRAVVVADYAPTPARAAAVSDTSARLTGDLQCPARHASCRYYFRWGTHSGYRSRSPLRRAHASSRIRRTSYVAAGLHPGTMYHYQLCVLAAGLPKSCGGSGGRPAGHFATGGCALYASPSGSRSGRGDIDDPLGSVRRLDKALAPGQTGCLEAGSYGGIHSVQRLTRSGAAGNPITITSAPGQTAKIIGLVELEGSYVTFSGLNIDGSNDAYDAPRSGTSCPYPVSNGLEIDGQHDIFENNNLYQSVASLRGNGMGIGWNKPANDTIVRYNRIHDVGQCKAFDQMIYLAQGSGVQIYDNWMWNDAHGWGVQVYPEASDARIYNNVIDHAGSGFVVGGSSQVAKNAIVHNIVLNSTGLAAAGLARGVAISITDPIGPGNSFIGNDAYDNPGGVSKSVGSSLRGAVAFPSSEEVAVGRNIAENPHLNAAAHHDYRASARSRLRGWRLWDGIQRSVTGGS
jgi:hypothetical protein